MEIEEIRTHYNTIDIPYIQKHIYTESKHQKFMETYGALLEELNTREIGKNLSIMVAIAYQLRKFAIAVGVIMLVNLPSFSIFLFNFTSLFMIMMVVYLKPFSDPNIQR